MWIVEHIREAWQIIRRNKIRSILTMLGIIIGVLSVIVIMSVGQGAQSLVLNQVKSLGSNLVGVLPGKSEDSGPPAAAFGIVVTTLTADDAKALMKSNSSIVSATGYVRGAATMNSGEATTDSSFVGVSASYLDVEDAIVAQGRFFTEDEERGIGRVVVLGWQVAKDLFGDQEALGRSVKIKRVSFQVIGVMGERGTGGFQNQDDQVFVPLPTAQKLLLGINYVNFVRAKIDDAANVEPAIEDMKVLLRERHNIDTPENDDFSVRSTNQGLDALTQVTNALRYFLAAIAAISLLVGGLGIMNIMLAAVEERTGEIGLRKALGATNANIIIQFLVETVTITFVGGLIGLVGGIIISILVALIAQNMGYSWELVISLQSIVLGCGVSIAIGLIFGVVPARRASRLNPIEALRYE